MLANERGAVTAEFMLLFPALISVVAILMFGLQLGLSAIALEREVAVVARQLGYGFAPTPLQQYELRSWHEGPLVCAELTKQGLIPIRSEQCVFRAGS